MAMDVVCGMEVEPKTAAAKVDYQGQTYYFCSEECKEAFEESPEDFIAYTEEEEEAA